MKPVDATDAAALHSLEQAQKAASYMAASLRGDKLAMAAALADLGAPTDVIHGLTRVVSQLALDLSNLTGDDPGDICAKVATTAAMAIELRRNHPSSGTAGPPG